MTSLLTLPLKLPTNIFRIGGLSLKLPTNIFRTGGILLVTELDALVSWSLYSGKQYLTLKILILGTV